MSCLHVVAFSAQLLFGGLPENLALEATISASSAFNQEYLGRFVADGEIPKAGGNQDVGKAWCVNGNTDRDRAKIVFSWKEPVVVKTLVYYARTAWFMNETWKDFALVADEEEEPFYVGKLDMVHGPQRISLPEKRRLRTLRVEFTSSYGGFNPGASEIQIFSQSVTNELLEEFMRSLAMKHMPWVDQVDREKLASLIERLTVLHGEAYEKRQEHDRLVGSLEKEKLPDLQREVLLFDVNRLVLIQRHEITASHVYTYHYEGFKPGGGLYVVSTENRTPEFTELVSSPTGQILDCDLSYDGKTVLFSWRRVQEEGYHIWRIDVNGQNLEQVTNGPWHDYNACWLPDGNIAFLSTREAQFAYCWHAPVGVLHRMDRDGSSVQKLSANYLNDFTPYVLEDGRLIYGRWEYVDKPAIPIQSLWTVNPDGTCLSVYFGNRVLSPGTFMEARQLPGTTKILCTMTGHNGPTRGAIGLVDRSLGINAQAAIQNLTPDVPLPKVNEGNGNTSGTKQYSCPNPLDKERFLVSIQGPLLVRDIGGGCQSLVFAAPENGMQYFCAQPIRPRPVPPTVSTVFSPNKPKTDEALLFVQDVYRGLEPYVKRGEVKAIRVVREMEKRVRIDPNYRAFGFQFPVISCGATYAGKDVLGEVPVAEDGSAHFRVPAQVPLYFMVLDEKGRALQRMRSFTHLMPRELQGCIGCHEPRHQTSPKTSPKAFTGDPDRLEPPEWGAGGFDYARVVQPVLDKHCIRCHDARSAPKGLDLTGSSTDFFNVSYEVLARDPQGLEGSPYVNWIPTYNGHEQNILKVEPKTWGSPRSKLAEIVLSGHPDKEGQTRFQMDASSQRRILAWIDLNVPYYGTSETAYPEMEGCRRLYPNKLDEVLGEVSKRRCASCHDGGAIPRRVWTRITEPELNSFLLAPLAKDAGGTEKCGKRVFESTRDPDYQAILETFTPIAEAIAKKPRMDMGGAKADEKVCRDRI